MNLFLQVLSFLFSFGYGYVLYILIEKQKRYLLIKSKKKRIVFTTLFFIDVGLLYFLVMKTLNEGIINGVFIFLVFIGALFKKYVK